MVKPKKWKAKWKEALPGYGFISLWLFGFIVFSLYPLCYSFYLSLNKAFVSGYGIETTFVGLQNYSKVLTLDMDFLRDITSFGKEIIISVPLIIIISMIIAMLLNSKIKGQTFFRAIFFLPVIIISGPLLDIFERNQVFEEMLYLENIPLLMALDNSSFEVLSSVVVFLVENMANFLWFTGVPILIFIVGFQKISKEMYEAAYVDGANGWQTFWKLTLPSLVGYIVINIIFTVIQIATMDTVPIIRNISRRMFDVNYGFGYAASIAWIYFLAMFLVIGFFLLLVMSFTRRKE